MKANGGKRISFLESAHQSYLKTAIAMPTSGHLKNSVDQCNHFSRQGKKQPIIKDFLKV